VINQNSSPNKAQDHQSTRSIRQRLLIPILKWLKEDYPGSTNASDITFCSLPICRGWVRHGKQLFCAVSVNNLLSARLWIPRELVQY